MLNGSGLSCSLSSSSIFSSVSLILYASDIIFSKSGNNLNAPVSS